MTVVLNVYMQRVVAYRRSLLEAIDKLVPQVDAAGYKATPGCAIVSTGASSLLSSSPSASGSVDLN